jgi:acyl-CoA synthetase (AMP-forming)/AMP-acid ligase II
MVVAFVAIASSATFAPLNPSYRASEYEGYLSALHPKALIIQSEMDSPATAVARRLDIPIIELVPDPAAAAGVFRLSGAGRPGPVSGGFARPDDSALVLSTSGTTARPKLVPLTHGNICASARSIAANLELGVQDRCLSVMPLYHIHGLIGAALSTLASGGGIVCPPRFEPDAFFAHLEEFRPSWYTATPTIHRAILSCAAEHAETIKRHPLRFIRSCSAPLAPEVAAELEHVLNAPVIEAYGMTEASHEICSNSSALRIRKVGSVGLPTGCELAIMDDAGNMLRPETIGEIVIRGPNVFGGYEGNAAANAAAFVNGWLRTGDQGSVDRDGYVFIKGRLKDIIKPRRDKDRSP